MIGTLSRRGHYPHRITIQSATTTRNDYGDEVETWADFVTRWANVKPLRGTERWTAQQVQPDITHEIYMRYVAGVTSDMRVVFKGRTINLKEVVNVEEKNVELYLTGMEET